MRVLVHVLLFAVATRFVAVAAPLSASDADALLTRAKAAADNYQVDEAITLYTQAIDSGVLSTKQLATAYAGRGEARDNYTTAYGIKDEELALALSDYRQARDFAPTHSAYGSIGGVLIALGAYADAASAYREMRRLESRPHWSLIGLARVERIQGHYEEALSPLDEGLRAFGLQGGTMPLHYHRGRVLYLKGDFAGATEAFTAGLVKQPDYFAAYQFRACAQARSGVLTAAVEDIERAVELRDAPPVQEAWEKTPYAKIDRQDLANDVTTIKAMAAGKAAEGAKLCHQSWNDGEKLRERSQLVRPDPSSIVRNEANPTFRPAAARAADVPRCERARRAACVLPR